MAQQTSVSQNGLQMDEQIIQQISNQQSTQPQIQHQMQVDLSFSQYKEKQNENIKQLDTKEESSSCAKCQECANLRLQMKRQEQDYNKNIALLTQQNDILLQNIGDSKRRESQIKSLNDNMASALGDIKSPKSANSIQARNILQNFENIDENKRKTDKQLLSVQEETCKELRLRVANLEREIKETVFCFEKKENSWNSQLNEMTQHGLSIQQKFTIVEGENSNLKQQLKTTKKQLEITMQKLRALEAKSERSVDTSHNQVQMDEIKLQIELQNQEKQSLFKKIEDLKQQIKIQQSNSTCLLNSALQDPKMKTMPFCKKDLQKHPPAQSQSVHHRNYSTAKGGESIVNEQQRQNQQMFIEMNKLQQQLIGFKEEHKKSIIHLKDTHAKNTAILINKEKSLVAKITELDKSITTRDNPLSHRMVADLYNQEDDLCNIEGKSGFKPKGNFCFGVGNLLQHNAGHQHQHIHGINAKNTIQNITPRQDQDSQREEIFHAGKDLEGDERDQYIKSNSKNCGSNSDRFDNHNLRNQDYVEEDGVIVSSQTNSNSNSSNRDRNNNSTTTTEQQSATRINHHTEETQTSNPYVTPQQQNINIVNSYQQQISQLESTCMHLQELVKTLQTTLQAKEEQNLRLIQGHAEVLVLRDNSEENLKGEIKGLLGEIIFMKETINRLNEKISLQAECNKCKLMNFKYQPPVIAKQQKDMQSKKNPSVSVMPIQTTLDHSHQPNGQFNSMSVRNQFDTYQKNSYVISPPVQQAQHSMQMKVEQFQQNQKANQNAKYQTFYESGQFTQQNDIETKQQKLDPLKDSMNERGSNSIDGDTSKVQTKHGIINEVYSLKLRRHSDAQQSQQQQQVITQVQKPVENIPKNASIQQQQLQQPQLIQQDGKLSKSQMNPRSNQNTANIKNKIMSNYYQLVLQNPQATQIHPMSTKNTFSNAKYNISQQQQTQTHSHNKIKTQPDDFYMKLKNNSNQNQNQQILISDKENIPQLSNTQTIHIAIPTQCDSQCVKTFIETTQQKCKPNVQLNNILKRNHFLAIQSANPNIILNRYEQCEFQIKLSNKDKNKHHQKSHSSSKLGEQNSNSIKKQLENQHAQMQCCGMGSVSEFKVGSADARATMLGKELKVKKTMTEMMQPINRGRATSFIC